MYKCIVILKVNFLASKCYVVILTFVLLNCFKSFGQEIRNFNDVYTGESFSYSRIDKYIDGSEMTLSHCDGYIFKKLGKFYYKRNFSGPINVKWFGVKGNADINDIGSDDTDSLINAINILNKIYKTQRMSGGNFYGGYQLYFPSGIYIINKTIILPDGITIMGESCENTVIHIRKPDFIFSNIRGMCSNGLDVLMSTDIKIKNITLKQGGIELQGAYNSSVDNVRIMNLFGNKSDTGILIKLSVNLKLRNIRIFSSTGTGILYEDTAGSGPSTTATFENIWVSHCKFGIIVNGNSGGSHGILTSKIYNSIFEYNDVGVIINGNVENYVMRDIHLEQNNVNINLNINGNIFIENVWSDKGILNIKGLNTNYNTKQKIYLKNVNMPQNIHSSYKGKIINN